MTTGTNGDGPGEASKSPTPEWVTRGKTIRQLVRELSTFENQDLEVRLSTDDGATLLPVSLVYKHQNRYCVLCNSEVHFVREPDR